MTKRTLLVTSVAPSAPSPWSSSAMPAAPAAKKPPKGKPSSSATPVFKLRLKPSQEVQASRASGRRRRERHVDLTRNLSGAITWAR